jgi:hypothetical protein
MISTWKKSSREFRGCWPLPPPPPSYTPRKSVCHPLPPSVGRNARQDSSRTNSTLNNNSHNSSARRTTTIVLAVAAVVVVALATPLLPRVRGPPTSTPVPALFKCGWVTRRGGGSRSLATSPTSAGYAGRCPSLRSTTARRATLHATTRVSGHPLWLAVGSSTSSSGSMVPMDGLMGSTVDDQLFQHHGPGPSCGHRLGSRLRCLQPHHLGCR